MGENDPRASLKELGDRLDKARGEMKQSAPRGGNGIGDTQNARPSCRRASRYFTTPHTPHVCSFSSAHCLFSFSLRRFQAALLRATPFAVATCFLSLALFFSLQAGSLDFFLLHSLQ